MLYRLGRHAIPRSSSAALRSTQNCSKQLELGSAQASIRPVTRTCPGLSTPAGGQLFRADAGSCAKSGGQVSLTAGVACRCLGFPGKQTSIAALGHRPMRATSPPGSRLPRQDRPETRPTGGTAPPGDTACPVSVRRNRPARTQRAPCSRERGEQSAPPTCTRQPACRIDAKRCTGDDGSCSMWRPRLCDDTSKRPASHSYRETASSVRPHCRGIAGLPAVVSGQLTMTFCKSVSRLP